jgi:hypothetical protein
MRVLFDSVSVRSSNASAESWNGKEKERLICSAQACCHEYYISSALSKYKNLLFQVLILGHRQCSRRTYFLLYRPGLV